LFGANRATRTHDAIAESGCFAVNILAVEHLGWGRRFAGLQPEISDRFQGISWFTAQTGAPIFPGVLGWLDCQVRQAFACGDHTIFVGEVTACAVRNDGAPLLYHHRNWRQLAEQILQLEG
jgi:flavin reductase (DIM6/NTAB) family NADH-FMN oxidoreductase RutF